jgi:hypothetical protein
MKRNTLGIIICFALSILIAIAAAEESHSGIPNGFRGKWVEKYKDGKVINELRISCNIIEWSRVGEERQIITDYNVERNGQLISFDSSVTFLRPYFGGEVGKGKVRITIKVKDKESLVLQIGEIKVQMRSGMMFTRPPEDHEYKKVTKNQNPPLGKVPAQTSSENEWKVTVKAVEIVPSLNITFITGAMQTATGLTGGEMITEKRTPTNGQFVIVTFDAMRKTQTTTEKKPRKSGQDVLAFLQQIEVDKNFLKWSTDSTFVTDQSGKRFFTQGAVKKSDEGYSIHPISSGTYYGSTTVMIYFDVPKGVRLVELRISDKISPLPLREAQNR